MRDHGSEVSCGHDLECFDRFSNSSDLIDLKQQVIAGFIFDCFLGSEGIRDEQIIANDFNFISDLRGERSIRRPVILIEGVFDRENRVLRREICEVFD